MQIRPGIAADAKRIAELIASFQPMLTLDSTGAGAELYLDSVSEAAERKYLESMRYQYMVAEANAAVVGFIAMRDKTHLFHLFVAAEHHRKGIAADLWRCAREQALRTGDVKEFTVNSSINALAVYRSFGFTPVGEQLEMHGISFQPMRLGLAA